jgi:hypothetical protein
VTAISPSAFQYSGVTSITGSDWTISAGLMMRLGKVFRCWNTTSSIRIPGNVREIEDEAFFLAAGLVHLSFEEGTVRIGASAFTQCWSLETAAFPASLTAIEARAFVTCSRLRQITFAAGSQLQYIRSYAFFSCPLNEVVVPASIREIDPSAFSHEVWRSCVRYEGRPLFSVNDDWICSVDSRVIVFGAAERKEVVIPSNIEVIAANAFDWCKMTAVLFESGTSLKEIRSRAFARCDGLTAFKVPESVEILGDRCFQSCSQMETIEFEGSSRLKKIGERAFDECRLHSILIPAATEEIDGSAFVNCALFAIGVAPGSRNFRVEGNLLITSDGTEIVRSFGLDSKVLVGRSVKVLGKSCFEGCKHLDQLSFETGSELGRIGPAALRDCVSLTNIGIPPSVIIVEQASFEGCTELESCFMDEDSSVTTIGATAFSKCTSLRSFSIPRLVFFRKLVAVADSAQYNFVDEFLIESLPICRKQPVQFDSRPIIAFPKIGMQISRTIRDEILCDFALLFDISNNHPRPNRNSQAQVSAPYVPMNVCWNGRLVLTWLTDGRPN